MFKDLKFRSVLRAFQKPAAVTTRWWSNKSQAKHTLALIPFTGKQQRNLTKAVDQNTLERLRQQTLALPARLSLRLGHALCHIKVGNPTSVLEVFLHHLPPAMDTALHRFASQTQLIGDLAN